jgi:hypothetical protein
MEETWREIQATAENSPIAFLGGGPIVQSGVTGN